MESAPQSTITHNAVIEFASDPVLPQAQYRGSGGRTKRRPALPKRAASNRAGPCQNRFPGATLRMAKTVDFGRYLRWIRPNTGFGEISQGWSSCCFRNPMESDADFARTDS